MKIAVLAWGSLVWNPRDLQIKHDWKTKGPILPIEFARISRDGRLTLVVTEELGSKVETYWSLSKYNDLNDAIENLRKREGTSKKSIGFLTTNSDLANLEPNSNDLHLIKNWAQQKGIDAVIWTGLPAKFKIITGLSYSVEHAFEYLENLDTIARKKALEYIECAPELTQTRFRDFFNTHKEKLFNSKDNK